MDKFEDSLTLRLAKKDEVQLEFADFDIHQRVQINPDELKWIEIAVDWLEPATTCDYIRYQRANSQTSGLKSK